MIIDYENEREAKDMLKCERCTVFLLDLKIYEEVFWLVWWWIYNDDNDDDGKEEDDDDVKDDDDDLLAAGRGGVASERFSVPTLPCQHYLQ